MYIYLRTTLWVIRALGGEGFQFSRAFYLDVRISTEARSGFSIELLLELSLKCSLDLPRDITGAITGAFPAELALELAPELALELALQLPLSNTFLYVVLTLQRKPKREQQQFTLSLRLLTSHVSVCVVLSFPYVKRKRLRCPYVILTLQREQSREQQPRQKKRK